MFEPWQRYEPRAWNSFVGLRCLETSVSDVSRHHNGGPCGVRFHDLVDTMSQDIVDTCSGGVHGSCPLRR